jgi:hypothetical protein
VNRSRGEEDTKGTKKGILRAFGAQNFGFVIFVSSW